MLKEGMYVRCPVDVEDPINPRVFAVGQVLKIDRFNECANIFFHDPFSFREYFDFVPKALEGIPLEVLDHCHFHKDAVVKYKRIEATVVEYKMDSDGTFEYYLQNNDTKEIFCVNEVQLVAPFLSGEANPDFQLKTYELQNPRWYFGRQIVKSTMNVLDNAMFGFKELAGCKIYLKAFQMNTIMQCVQEDRCRYMLADEVGLGKTIEACAVLKIYLSNKAERKILITVPRVLIGQWRTELLFKFGITEGENGNGNVVHLIAVEDISLNIETSRWDFVIVDEVHNYLKSNESYEKIHDLSKNADNILLLSATPIQQRQSEYLSLLRLILPDKYDEVELEEFSILVEKQNNISRWTHELLDELDSFRNEILPEVDCDDPHDDEDVQDELEEIEDSLVNLAHIIGDPKLSEMVSAVDFSAEDFGIYSIRVIISFICDNFQIERNIIRGRRAVLGVYPTDPDGEFAERELEELTYVIDDEKTYYENDAYRALTEWIVSHQDELDSEEIINVIKSLLEAFFSSPWAYVSRLQDVEKYKVTIPQEVLSTANRWLEDEESVINDLANAMDDVESHPSRFLKLIDYIDANLFGKKVVIFTDQQETFEAFYKMLRSAFGDEVTCFGASNDPDENEINMYRFQSNPKCTTLVCDKTGGEGRNLQIADYVVHIDLPWNINAIEQRIGRLDRMGRDITKPITSVVIHSVNSYEDQLFRLWNEGLNVFQQSLSGLEIIMNDINQSIVQSISEDFEYGVYRLIPKLIEESNVMRERVQKEQIFDTAALRYKPIYIQLQKLLADYQFNENEIFANTMMSWASLVGFIPSQSGKRKGLVSFDENHFSIRSAQNAFLIPPNWGRYMSKKQNALMIRVQRGIEEKKKEWLFTC